jgi:peptidoglycan/LPS O-acetylase OafA/YrhL
MTLKTSASLDHNLENAHRLSAAAHGKDNNFNLIRFAAAFAVLVSHSFAAATGSASSEPLRTTYGLTWGDIAVNIFFIASGFLVTSSLLTRKSATAFLWARALRIYPALWLMLAITVFVLGSLLTTHPLRGYLEDPGTWHYLLKNAILFKGIDYNLPGLFESNPWKYAVNGSLWSLTPEVRMYTLLLALWLTAATTGARRATILRLAIIGTVIISGAWYLYHGAFEPASDYPRLTFMFFTGASFYVLRDAIQLRRSIFLALLSITLLSLLQRTAFFFVFNLSLAYMLLYAAYAFGGVIREFNRLGDYSYGIYIYAGPVQQSLAALIRHISVAEMIALSAIITLPLAVLSWHLLEKRALRLKSSCANRTQAWVDAWRSRRVSNARI